MNDIPAARSVGAVLQRMAGSFGASAASTSVVSHGRAADRAAGLAASAEALGAAGCDAPSVLGHEDDGRPRWPAGFTGSIAHAGGVAVAVAAERAHVGVLGVDVEVAGALPAGDADAVLDPAERALVGQADRRDQLVTLLWSAKEAAFKAWCTATDGGLGDVDPVDIHVDLDAHDGHDHEPSGVRVDARGALAERTAAVGPLWGSTVQQGGYVVVLVTAGPRRVGQPSDGMASAAITRPSAANATT